MWKQCTKCKKILPLYLFTKDKSKPFSVYSSCKQCVKSSEPRQSKKYKKYKKEYNIQWCKNNPEKRAEQWRRYEMTKFNSEGWHSKEDWDFIKKSSGYKCLRCGRTDVKLTEDHITPLSEGGHDYILNIQPLCQSCNSIKGVKFTDYRPPELYKAVLEYFS